MTAKTMLDVDVNPLLEGDPLQLRAVEESYAWNPDGKLPDWLDGSDLDDEDDSDVDGQPSMDVTGPNPFLTMSANEADAVRAEIESPAEPSRDDDLPTTIETASSPVSESVCEPMSEPAASVAIDAVASAFESDPASPEVDAPISETASTDPIAEIERLLGTTVTPTVAIAAESTTPAPSLVEPANWPASDVPASDVPASDVPASDAPISDAPASDAGDLRSINDILRFVDEPTTPTMAAVSAHELVLACQDKSAATPPRRRLSFEEMVDLRHCLLVRVGDRLWGAPLDHVVSTSRRVAERRLVEENAADGRPATARCANGRSADGTIVDLHLRQEGRKLRKAGRVIFLSNGLAASVDEILGPRTLAWKRIPENSGALPWELARALFAGERVSLLDCDLPAE